jgi:hypothetical protein
MDIVQYSMDIESDLGTDIEVAVLKAARQFLADVAQSLDGIGNSDELAKVPQQVMAGLLNIYRAGGYRPIDATMQATMDMFADAPDPLLMRR